jgi:hypothetical protein
MLVGMVTVYLLIVMFLGTPALLCGAIAGRGLARWGRSATVALVTGVGIGLACGALPAVVLVHQVQSSSDANAGVGLIALPIPFVTNLVTGTLATYAAHAWSTGPSPVGDC